MAKKSKDRAKTKATKQAKAPTLKGMKQAKAPASPAVDEVDAGTDEVDPSAAIASLVALKEHHPPLREEQRAAFRSLATDAERMKMANQTKASGVLGDALRWAVQIDADLRGHPGVTSHYAVSRFAYFLECTLSLAQQLRAEREGATTVTTSRARSQNARSVALAARKTLVRALESFAGRRAAEREALAGALGRTVADDDLALSLQNLAALAGEWLALKDTTSVELAAAAGLVQAKIDAVVEARKALIKAGKDATLAGRAAGKDTPAVSVREGSVLIEMEEALAALEEANEADPTVRRLSPGKATRRVLLNRPKEAAPEKEDPTPEEPKKA